MWDFAKSSDSKTSINEPVQKAKILNIHSDNILKYFVKYKAVEVLAVIPRPDLKTSKNFIKKLKETNLTKSIPILKFKNINYL